MSIETELMILAQARERRKRDGLTPPGSWHYRMGRELSPKSIPIEPIYTCHRCHKLTCRTCLYAVMKAGELQRIANAAGETLYRILTPRWDNLITIDHRQS